MMSILTDNFGRTHDYLRLSVTDKCNFKCFYCNPNNDNDCKTNKNSILSYEEIIRIIELFASQFAFKKFRFTGGEPFVRNNFIEFLSSVKILKDKYNFEIGITTNGYLLEDKLEKLRILGIDKLNISLDTLNKDKFRKITSIDAIDKVINSINTAIKIGYKNLKVNSVIIKDVNDNEIIDFVEFAIQKNINIRFIEYMPFADNNWSNSEFISYQDMKEIVDQKYRLIPIINDSKTVAKDYKISNYNGKVSFISSISDHFCGTCNRLRISSNGEYRTCLFGDDDKFINFKKLFENGLSNSEIAVLIRKSLQSKWEKHPEARELKELKYNNMIRIGG